MNVSVDGEPRPARVGATLITLLTDGERRAAEAGELVVVDRRGRRHGLEGAVADGGAYFTVTVGARPPAVGACLTRWDDLFGEPAVPRPFAKFLLRRAIDIFRQAGGAASPTAVAAFARELVNREDSASLWEYVAGAGRAVAVYSGGESRVRAICPAVKKAVIATRDMLTFRSGVTVARYLDGIALIEIGTTNKVRLCDYVAAGAGAEAVIAWAAGDFAMEGFVERPSPAALAAAARAAGKKTVFIYADVPMLRDGTPPDLAADVTIFATPQEARDYDVVVGEGIPVGPGRLRDAAARQLWRAIVQEAVYER